MPEFAEVNVQVRYLRERCVGWEIASFGHKGRSHFKALRELAEGVQFEMLKDFFEGNTIKDITQRGKQIIFRMERGLVTTHLMFRGRWSVAEDPFTCNYKHHTKLPTEKENTVWLEMTNGQRLNFHDSDYKGHVSIYPNISEPSEIPGLAKLGLEVLVTAETDEAFSQEWDLAAFQKQASRSKQAIKAFLLEQKKQSGLGNMYVCESLYRAKIAPERPANSLSKDEAERLFDHAQGILLQSIDSGLDYDQVLLIYKREVDPNGDPVEKIQVGGRDTFWVPKAQK